MFLAHAVLRLSESSYREAGDRAMLLRATEGQERLASHYPMSADDSSQLADVCRAFEETAVGPTPPFTVAAPNFVGRCTAQAVDSLLGSPQRPDHGVRTSSALRPGPAGAAPIAEPDVVRPLRPPSAAASGDMSRR